MSSKQLTQTLEFSYHLAEIDNVAKEILNNLSSKTVLFSGDMGTGKTTLIKTMVRLIGSDDSVSSPTYSLVNEYCAGNVRIFHFDLYRLKSEKEAFDIGFEDYVENGDFIFIEWPEKVMQMLPEKVDSISITINDDASRALKLNQNIDLTDKKLMMPQNLQ